LRGGDVWVMNDELFLMEERFLDPEVQVFTDYSDVNFVRRRGRYFYRPVAKGGEAVVEFQTASVL